MSEIVQEKVTTQSQGPTAAVTTETRNVASGTQTVEYLIYFLLGTLEVLLVFRLVLKMMGASTTSAFVNLIYGITGIFILPFEGIFRRGINQGLETSSVFEPATVVAIIVYAVLAWGVVKLIRIFSGEKMQTV